MEDIARMADECMRDVDNDEDDSSLEDDEDLLVGVDSFDQDGNFECVSVYEEAGCQNTRGGNKLLWTMSRGS